MALIVSAEENKLDGDNILNHKVFIVRCARVMRSKELLSFYDDQQELQSNLPHYVMYGMTSDLRVIVYVAIGSEVSRMEEKQIREGRWYEVMDPLESDIINCYGVNGFLIVPHTEWKELTDKHQLCIKDLLEHPLYQSIQLAIYPYYVNKSHV